MSPHNFYRKHTPICTASGLLSFDLEILLPIALLAFGVALIVVEVYFVPGFNFVGVVGALFILFAIGYAFSEKGLLGGGIMLIGASAAVGLSFYFMFQSGAWNRFVLKTNLGKDDVTIAREREQRSKYLGKVGVALSPLRPTGIVEIDGERIEVSTEGEFISSGSAVRVVAMDRRRFFVRLHVQDDSIDL